MPIPMIYPYPIERPGFISNAIWSGSPGDHQLQLTLQFTDNLGLPASITLLTLDHPDANLCLPSSTLIGALADDLLIAHVRMAGMISGTVPGSREYFDAVTTDGQGNARNFQTPIGDVKVTAAESQSDILMKLTMQKGTQTPREVLTTIGELASYSFAPSTQLLVIAGSIKKQFPTYVQDPATNDYLTQQQMDDIAAYVLGLKPWI